MPRGDGTGPLGTGPLGRGRSGCRRIGSGNNLGTGAGRGRQARIGTVNNTTATPEDLEAQARQLEEQAANLRNLAKQRKPE